MKKVLTALAIATLSNQSFAAAEKPQPKQLPLDGKPAVVLQVLDTSGKVARPIQGNKLTISKKQNRLCWSSLNIPVQGKIQVAEAFYAPAPFNLVSAGSQVDVSPDKMSYTIVSQINSVNNQYVSRCWSFDASDPIGKYQLEIQIGNQVFKGLSFEIAK